MTLIRELTDRMEDLPLSLDGVLYVPLGAGHHVDHRIVRRAVEERWRNPVYYEDYPYAEDEENLEAAKAEGVWRAELIPLSDEDLDAKIEAITRYRSQLSSFWAERSDMEAAVRAFVSKRGTDVPAERYWHLISDT
jgi:LmbE family N-acetylglucosaminyl deacetylase